VAGSRNSDDPSAPDSRRHPDDGLALHRDQAIAPAPGARSEEDVGRATAGRTIPGEAVSAERLPRRRPDPSPPQAGGARDHPAHAPSSGASPARTSNGVADGDLPIFQDLAGGQLDSEIHVVSRARTGGGPSRTPEGGVERNAGKTSPLASGLGPSPPSFPEARIGEDLVGRRDHLESLFGFPGIGVAIRVVPEGQPSKSVPDGVAVGVPRHAEHTVGVEPFGHSWAIIRLSP
jgi:hypothetical protein